MRKILLILFAFWLIPGFAQNISVSSFKSLDTDLTANTAGTMEKDQNGETAALIKVVTTQTGFTFDGGALGIVKTKQTPGEIWVYIPRGSKKITIKHPQLGVLRDYFFPVAIESARTYEMVLIAGEVQTVVKQARTSQYVVFQLTPPDAVVELDGELLKTEGGVASKMMKFGTYNYRVQAPNYLLEAGSVTVDDPNNKKVVNISLKPNFALVTINVDNNAEIWVNGEKKGEGSWSGNLGAGTYELEAKKEGHRSTTTTQDFIVTAEPQIVKLQTPTPIYGEVNFNSSPGMADIYLDDKKIGQTPSIIPDILIGNHKLRISKEGYDDFTSTIIVKEKEDNVIEAKLNETQTGINHIWGYIDAQSVLQAMPEYSKAQTEIKALQNQYEAELKRMQDELQKKSEAFDKEQAYLPDNIKQRRQIELQDLYQKIQQSYQDNNQALQKASKEKMEPMTSKILHEIDIIGRKYNFINIWDKEEVHIVNKKFCNDVTDLVKYQLGCGGKNTIELSNLKANKAGFVNVSEIFTKMISSKSADSSFVRNQIAEAMQKVAMKYELAFIINKDELPFINNSFIMDVNSLVKKELNLPYGQETISNITMDKAYWGIMDTQGILLSMPEYKKAESEIIKLQQKYEAELNSMQEEFQKKSESFDREKSSLSSSMRQYREKELQDSYQIIQETYQRNQQALQNASAEKMGAITSKILDALYSIGQDGHFAIIYEKNSIPFTNSNIYIDVTNQVKRKLGL